MILGDTEMSALTSDTNRYEDLELNELNEVVEDNKKNQKTSTRKTAAWGIITAGVIAVTAIINPPLASLAMIPGFIALKNNGDRIDYRDKTEYANSIISKKSGYEIGKSFEKDNKQEYESFVGNEKSITKNNDYELGAY
jgi:hypothetical protein